jgi:hypothetical protein
MRKAVLAAIAAALLLPAGAFAAPRDNGPPQQAIDNIATAICSGLQKKLGSSFSAQYASVDACVAAQQSAASTIAGGCLSSGKPGTDAFKQCAQSGIKSAVQAAPGGTGGGNTQKQADTIAANICAGLQKKLGDAFSKTYSSLDDCKAKFAGVATSAVASCSSSGKPGSDAYKSCVQAAVKSAVDAQAAANKAANVQKQKDKVAADICTALQKKLGDKFSNRFASLADCEAKVATTAANAVSSCSSSGKPGSDAFKACIKTAVGDAVKAQAAEHKSDAQAKAVAALEMTICTGLQKKLGDSFSAKYASVADCKSAVSATATAAVASCTSSAKGDKDAYKSCVQAAVKTAIGK